VLIADALREIGRRSCVRCLEQSNLDYLLVDVFDEPARLKSRSIRARERSRVSLIRLRQNRLAQWIRKVRFKRGGM
jgi:hypothetical protein